MPEVRNINLMIADGDRIDDSIAVMVKAIDRELLTVRDIMLLVDIKSILHGIKKAWDAGKCV